MLDEMFCIFIVFSHPIASWGIDSLTEPRQDFPMSYPQETNISSHQSYQYGLNWPGPILIHMALHFMDQIKLGLLA